MKNLLFLVLFLSSLSFLAQELINPPDHIKSIQFSASENGVFTPIVRLGGQLYFSFDDLEADEKDYYYEIKHYDKNWQESDLVSSEFINGYNKEQIRDYENSFNTLQDYTHYQLKIPNKFTQIKISGNYIINILDDYDEVIFSRYFIVYEPITTVGVSVHRSRDVTFIDSQQSVQFIINHPNMFINNPKDEIYPVLIQNGDLNTRVSGLKPQFIRNEQLIYKYDAETSFWGGNEFLYFDSKEIRMANMNIAKVENGPDLYHSYLYTDIIRAYDAYTYYPDVNGNFVIRNLDADDSTIEADYTWVHFNLKADENLLKKNIYVYGNFNNYQFDENNKLSYHSDTQTYETAILLKQGFYNYAYAILNDKNEIDLTTINGSFDETENEYQVLVYYAKYGSHYDSVIGYGTGSSKNLEQ